VRLQRAGHLCTLASQAAARSTSPHSKHTLRELFRLRQGELCCAGPGSMQRRRSAPWTRSGDHRRSRPRTRPLRHKGILLTLTRCSAVHRRKKCRKQMSCLLCKLRVQHVRVLSALAALGWATHCRKLSEKTICTPLEGTCHFGGMARALMILCYPLRPYFANLTSDDRPGA